MASIPIKRAALVVAFVGLSVGGWLATRDAGPVVNSIGGTWIAPDATWYETDGAYRATLTFEAQRVELVNANQLELLSALCQSTLDQVDVLAPGGVTASMVYRLDLNVTAQDGSLVYERSAPVAVRDGTCQPAITNDAFFPTYPAPLDDWFVAGGGMANAGDDGIIPAVQFQNLPGTQPALETFDMLFACAMLIGDDLVWAPAGQTAPTTGKVRIVARSGSSLGSVAAIGVQLTQDVIIEGGTCQLVEPA